MLTHHLTDHTKRMLIKHKLKLHPNRLPTSRPLTLHLIHRRPRRHRTKQRPRHRLKQRRLPHPIQPQHTNHAIRKLHRHIRKLPKIHQPQRPKNHASTSTSADSPATRKYLNPNDNNASFSTRLCPCTNRSNSTASDDPGPDNGTCSTAFSTPNFTSTCTAPRHHSRIPRTSNARATCDGTPANDTRTTLPAGSNDRTTSRIDSCTSARLLPSHAITGASTIGRVRNGMNFVVNRFPRFTSSIPFSSIASANDSRSVDPT